MRVLHAIANLISLALLVGVPALYLSLCRGMVTCVEQVPLSLQLVFGAVPAACFLVAAVISQLNWRHRLSQRVVVPAAFFGAVAAYASVAVAVLAYERLFRPSLEDAVPAIVAAMTIVLLWLPVTALWNAALLSRANCAKAGGASTDAA